MSLVERPAMPGRAARTPTGGHARRAEDRVDRTERPGARSDRPVRAAITARERDRVVLDDILSIVVRDDASDLHLTVGAPPTIRLHGVLAPVPDFPPLLEHEVEALAMSILDDEQRGRFLETNELDVAYAYRDVARFRVNVYRQRGSVGAALRLVPRRVRGLEELGLPPAVAAFAQLPRGLVLVTGPTGSGKSTTLAGVLDLANRTRSAHIVTIEDPIEYVHEHRRSLVNQREVGSDTASFAEALRRGLRQDPDIILVGELRDLETTSVALTAAETGHLVLATLHTQDAAQTVDRLIDIFPPHQQHQVRVQVAATLQGVLCQSLLPMASGHGRVLAPELMVMTPAIRALIREGKTHQLATAIQTGTDLGMVTFDASLAQLVQSGQISRRLGLDLAHDVTGFKSLIGAA